MTCEDQQQRISALIDAELSPEEARPVCQLLAECGECSGLYYRLIALANMLDRFADPLPGGGLPDSLRKSSAKQIYPGPWWRRRVSMGVPALAFLLCMIIGGIFITVRYLYQAETVYVTKLPTVVITAEGGRE